MIRRTVGALLFLFGAVTFAWGMLDGLPFPPFVSGAALAGGVLLLSGPYDRGAGGRTNGLPRRDARVMTR